MLPKILKITLVVCLLLCCLVQGHAISAAARELHVLDAVTDPVSHGELRVLVTPSVGSQMGSQIRYAIVKEITHRVVAKGTIQICQLLAS